jgi:S1-C subfamily serine protease
VWRDGKNQVVDVTLRNRSGKAKLEDFASAAEENYQSLGATFETPSYEDLSTLRITGGAKITDIQQGKFKSLGMQKGFIITRIGDKKINSPAELKEALVGKEGSYVEIRGMYSNGMEAMYGFKL